MVWRSRECKTWNEVKELLTQLPRAQFFRRTQTFTYNIVKSEEFVPCGISVAEVNSEVEVAGEGASELY